MPVHGSIAVKNVATQEGQLQTLRIRKQAIQIKTNAASVLLVVGFVLAGARTYPMAASLD